MDLKQNKTHQNPQGKSRSAKRKKLTYVGALTLIFKQTLNARTRRARVERRKQCHINKNTKKMKRVTKCDQVFFKT